MDRRWPIPLLWLLPFAGCLQEGPAPTGQLLFRGDHLESPRFITVGDQSMERFEDRRAYATTTQGGVCDVWITSFDGTSQRKVVTNRSDYWPEQQINAGEESFMVDERSVASAPGPVRAGSLVRLGPTLEEKFRLEGISRYLHFTVPIGAIYDNPPSGRT